MNSDVWVDGRRWRQVTSFADTRSEDEVYVLDAENGSIHFGDGTNGRRPRMGAEVVVAVYRSGSGGSGDVGSEGPPIQISRPGVDETTDLALWTVIRAGSRSIPIPGPWRKRGPARES